MAKDNDNREEDLDQEEDFDIEDDDAAEVEDEDSDDDGSDDEEEEDSADADDEKDEDEEDSEDDEEEGEDDEDEDEEDEDPDYDPKLDPSGKFKGKSKKEIMQSYRNLERSIGTKAQEMAQAILKQKGIKAKPTADDAKDEEGDDLDFDLGLTDEEIAKMKPGEFGKHISRKILEKATEIARNTIDRTNEVRSNVSREIKEATAAHPHLKENPDYREIVINMIEAAAGRGEVLSLKEACKKADKAMGIKPKDGDGKGGDGKGGDGKPKKKNRMSVEKPGGSDGGKVKNDADRVRDGLLGGRSSTGNLGGLGV